MKISGSYKCGIKFKIILKKQNHWTLWDHVIPSAFYSFHLISFTRISIGPSQHKSGSLNNKYEYHSTSQSTARKSPANVRTPSITSSEPLPKRPGSRKPFRGHDRRCWSRPPWPPQRSAARPRRHGVSQPPDAAPSSLGRRGCDAEGGRLRLLSRNKAIVMGCFSGWLGKKMWIGHTDIEDDRRSTNLILFVSFSVRHGEKQEEQSSQIFFCSMVLFKSYKQLHLTFAASCVTCQKNSSWITLEYPSADKPFSQVKK